MFIQALISYERRKVVTSVSIYKFNSQVYLLLGLAIVIGIAIWVIISIPLEVLQFIKVVVQLPNNDTTVMDVCTTSEMLGIFGLIEIIFAITQFIVPVAFIIYNYW